MNAAVSAAWIASTSGPPQLVALEHVGVEALPARSTPQRNCARSQSVRGRQRGLVVRRRAARASRPDFGRRAPSRGEVGEPVEPLCWFWRWRAHSTPPCRRIAPAHAERRQTPALLFALRPRCHGPKPARLRVPPLRSPAQNMLTRRFRWGIAGRGQCAFLRTPARARETLSRALTARVTRTTVSRPERQARGPPRGRSRSHAWGISTPLSTMTLQITRSADADALGRMHCSTWGEELTRTPAEHRLANLRPDDAPSHEGVGGDTDARVVVLAEDELRQRVEAHPDTRMGQHGL